MLRPEEEVRREEEEYRSRIEEQQKRMRMIGTGDKTDDGTGEDGDVLARPVRRRTGTVRRNRPKIGRNDPCWCGSGKKYKSCHLNSDRTGETSPDGGGDEARPG